MIQVLDSAGSTLVEWGRQQQQQQVNTGRHRNTGNTTGTQEMLNGYKRYYIDTENTTVIHDMQQEYKKHCRDVRNGKWIQDMS